MLDEVAAEILVVDDTPANLKLLTSLLTEQGYQVRPASSGVLALRSVAVKAPDLILLDVRMPDLDGYAVCQQLKADPRTHSIPVIFISALHEATDKVQGFAVGGVDYITKPFEPTEVLARVHTHLELWRLQQCLEQRVAARTAELAEANRALQKSEERLRLVIEATNDGIWDWNLRTDELFFSDRWYTMLDYAPGEFAASYANWRDRVHPDDLATAEAALQAHLDGRLSECDIEYRMCAKDGDWRWINSRGKVIEWDMAGKPLRMVGANVDITERKRAEEALRASEHKFRTVVQNAQAITFILDRQGVFLLSEGQGLARLGLAPGQVVGLSALDLYKEHPSIVNSIRKALSGELAHVTNVLGDVLFDTIYSPYYDPDGQLSGVIGIAIDITERKRAEEELQRHREHLEELVTARTTELRQAMTQLVQVEKLAALGNLVAGVAHELNTPLGNARLVASTLGEDLREFAAAVEAGALRRSQVDAFLRRSREAVDLLERNTVRAADLISHFKQVAVDQTSVRRRCFNLRQTVEEMLVTLHPLFKRTAHRIEVEIPSDLELDSYPGPLEQIIANLISNSLSHGFAGVEAGHIRMQAKRLDASRLTLRYTDNGVGIPTTLQARIFEPFFTTQLGQGGSGLGLYIVYTLVTGVLGGIIQVDSQPGGGTAFTLTLPCTAPERQTQGMPS